ncbi:amidophosphoribosyltransferase [Thalassospira sp. MCCC 1A03138]|uniref:amidophosphoribosyltransferase n=1 Tax=Thalassospira sp. MCCC 1A03138 TaxID=1470576 RepID=UPI000A1D9C96|nr:amidophosphoribosyltransferase [Thalassospira sp. MCCC 1A03138]OSQ30238.1 amidophosphoribosyltransferase [Thalassospira sp. MCCC 1A03138]
MLTTNPFEDDKLREECGVFGVFGSPDAAALTALGLHALQHRGQEAAGIVSYDGEDFPAHRAPGQVGDIFGSEDVIKSLQGHRAIGHVRYSTAGGKGLRNVQPLFADFEFGGLAIAHNGNLTNALAVRERLVKRGSIFQSTSDTETFIHLIATSLYEKIVDRLIDAIRQVEGAYSLVVMTQKKLIGVRDPLGVRPLVLGKLNDSYILSSETVGLDIVGAEFIRDVEPGEIVEITDDGLKSIKPFKPVKSRFCIFEHVYFARPDSIVEGTSVYDVRKNIGRELALESGVEADVVVPIPDSGVPSALGYAEASGVPFELGIIRNHYVGRTFIEPTDQIRHLGVKLKHNANPGKLKGKRVILVDDSIVRGTTSTKIVDLVRQAGAAEVHMRIASPPTTNPCFYGVDTPSKEKLMAANHDIESMAKIIGVDSLAFVTIDGLYRAAGLPGRDNDSPAFCDACFTGDYPIRLVDHQAENKDRKLSQLVERQSA